MATDLTNAYQPTVMGNAVTPYIPWEIQSAYRPQQYTFGEIAAPTLTMPSISLASSVPGVGDLTFNWSDEMRKAYESLKPFYQQLLNQVGGDLDLAKRTLEYSYQTNTRQAIQENEQQLGNLALAVSQEREQLQTAQNRRGITESGFGETTRRQMGESQNLRRQAIQQAYENRMATAGAERGFGLEQAQRAYEKERTGLARQQQQEAGQQTQNIFGIQQQIWQNQMQKAQAEEQRRIAQEQAEQQKKLFEQQYPTETQQALG